MTVHSHILHIRWLSSHLRFGRPVPGVHGCLHTITRTLCYSENHSRFVHKCIWSWFKINTISHISRDNIGLKRFWSPNKLTNRDSQRDGHIHWTAFSGCKGDEDYNDIWKDDQLPELEDWILFKERAVKKPSPQLFLKYKTESFYININIFNKESLK